MAGTSAQDVAAPQGDPDEFLQCLIEPFEDLEDAFLFSGEKQDVPWLKPLNDPTWVATGDASHMRPDDPVVGLFLEGEAWALPWWVLKNHHVANFQIGGQAVVVDFCDRCSSASAFDPHVSGQRHTFRMVGIRKGTILVGDDQTGSFWSPFTGRCILGEHLGQELRRLPVFQCTWAEWLELHPASRVVSGEGETREGHAHDQHPGARGFGFVLAESLPEQDKRHPPFALVLGVEVGETTRAYPLSLLDEHAPVLEDTLADTPLAIFHKPGSWLAIAYRRELEGRVLQFTADEDGRIVDRETGSHWGFDGRAVGGPLAGKELDYCPSGVEEWYIWAIQHPETDLKRAKKGGK